MTYDRRDYRDKWRLERTAKGVRQEIGLDQYEPLDPQRLADHLGAHIFYPGDFGIDVLAKRVGRARWDGLAFVLPDGTLVILLNAERPLARQTATLMEEFSHHLLEHQPCTITPDETTGCMQRSFDASQEAEAYDLGSAILLPKERIQRDVAERRTAQHIADIHGCSRELVVYRIKRMRLWQRYLNYAA